MARGLKIVVIATRHLGTVGVASAQVSTINHRGAVKDAQAPPFGRHGFAGERDARHSPKRVRTPRAVLFSVLPADTYALQVVMTLGTKRNGIGVSGDRLSLPLVIGSAVNKP